MFFVWFKLLGIRIIDVFFIEFFKLIEFMVIIVNIIVLLFLSFFDRVNEVVC